jgi:hypothetical protein
VGGISSIKTLGLCEQLEEMMSSARPNLDGNEDQLELLLNSSTFAQLRVTDLGGSIVYHCINISDPCPAQ